MATFIPLVFPAMWLIDNTGLKNVALIGSGLNAAGSLIKCFGISQSAWWLVFIGQTVSACAQCFILELPPKIAAIWFPASEIATATSLGVFGNQLGVALGFLIPPKIIKGPRTAFIGSNKWINGKETNQTYQGKTYPNYEWTDTTKYNETVVENAIQEVRGQINILYWGFAAITAVLFILVFLVFKDKPARPANRASIKRSDTMEATQSEEQSSTGAYIKSILSLVKDIPFLLLVLSYGLNVGVYYAISTLLNPIIKPTFYDPVDDKGHSDDFYSKLDERIGQMGTFMVVAGLAGSMVGGMILDKFKKFKLTTLVTYTLSLVFMIAFTYAIDLEDINIDYFIIAALGFFMTGYLPIGFEFGAEITFPESEASSSGLLNCSAQIFGIAVTAGSQALVNYFVSQAESLDDENQKYLAKIKGGWYANIAMIACLIVGLILTAFIKENLKRQRAENENEETHHAEEGQNLLASDA